MFKTHARNKMLAFKRILNSEFPLRMLPLDYLETLQDDDGFDHIVSTDTSLSITNKKRVPSLGPSKQSSKAEAKVIAKSIYILCFVSMVQIEAYLKAHDLLIGSDNLAS